MTSEAPARRARKRSAHAVLAQALQSGDLSVLAALEPCDRRDRFLTLLALYDLHTAPLDTLGDAARLQGHPAVAELKARLEQSWLAELEEVWADAEPEADPSTVEGAVTWIRGVAVQDRLPEAYRWLAEEASREQLDAFLALEGGPDAGFDDLVAICQVGMSGEAKLELGKNYWDEMGNGTLSEVHTQLHHDVCEALRLPVVPREELPVEALERAALNGLLATNRWLQPEMLGALGLTELQAGPRCRLVLKAFDRLGVSPEAYPFYEVHADVDPVHGKDWVEKVIMPTVAQHPAWGERILRGAVWRARLNLAFFSAAHARLARGAESSQAA
ncbi:MAG TPA: iron-containing redox enzyme family protein [Mycobacteriales bacterium]|nr:iron-containing redox enzyme family protein [Mycobacteriales bacterium]